MSDNVSVEAVKQVVSNNSHGLPSPVGSEAPASTQQDLAQWQQVMQAYYKQQQQQQQQQQQAQGQQTAFYPAAAHPYAGFFAGQVGSYIRSWRRHAKLLLTDANGVVCSL